MLEYTFAFSPAELKALFKFTIVRNPWDRLVSAYLFLKAGGVNDSDRRWSEKHLSRFGDFEEFVLRWVTPANVGRSLHLRPQVEFLCRPARDVPLVDYVGYFENLQADFAAIVTKLGIEATLAKINTTATRRDDYRSYYSGRTREIVQQVYRDDIAAFGYDFDNADLDSVLRRRDQTLASPRKHL